MLVNGAYLGSGFSSRDGQVKPNPRGDKAVFREMLVEHRQKRSDAFLIGAHERVQTFGEELAELLVRARREPQDTEKHLRVVVVAPADVATEIGV